MVVSRHTIFGLLLSVLSITPALATDFAGIYIFGDSVSDNGQFGGGLSFTDPVVPTPNPNPVYGDVWSDDLAATLGVPLEPSTPLEIKAPGNNYAVGGFRSGSVLSSIVDPASSPGVGNAPVGVTGATVVAVGGGVIIGERLRDGYLVEHGRAMTNALHVVWGGGNDLRDARDARFGGGGQAALITSVTTAATNIVNGAVALANAGAKYILVPNYLDIGAIPESASLGSQAEGAEASAFFNDALTSQLNALDINVIQVDMLDLFSEMVANPTAYGFVNSNECYSNLGVGVGPAGTAVPCTESAQYGRTGATPDPSVLMFFDGIHPTQAGHRIVSDYLTSILYAPTQISILAEVPLSIMATHQRLMFNELHKGVRGKAGRVFPFVVVDYSTSDVNARDRSQKHDDRISTMISGARYYATEQLQMGLGVGITRADVNYGSDAGGFDVSNNIASTFIDYDAEPFFVRSMASYNKLNFDVLRLVNLGPVHRPHASDTEGHQVALQLVSGFHVGQPDHFTVTPQVGITVQQVRVNHLTELSTLSTGMHFHHQTRRSVKVDAGVRLDYPIQHQGWQYDFYGQFLQSVEAENSARDIVAGLNSMPATQFYLPGFDPETSAFQGVFGVRTILNDKLALNLSYQHRAGNKNGTQQSLDLSVQFHS